MPQSAARFGGFSSSWCDIRDVRTTNKRGKIVDSGCIFNLSLRRRQCLTEGVEEVLWLFGAVKKSSKLVFIWLLSSAIAETKLIFFCFSIPSAWELSKALLGVFLIFIWLYTYKIDQISCLLAQVWQRIWYFWGRKKGNKSITIIIGWVLPTFILTLINLLALIDF